MKVHSFVKDTIAMAENEAKAVAAKKTVNESFDRPEAGTPVAGESSEGTPQAEKEEGATEEKKAKAKGKKNKKDL